jgi:hypothetical protein
MSPHDASGSSKIITASWYALITQIEAAGLELRSLATAAARGAVCRHAALAADVQTPFMDDTVYPVGETAYDRGRELAGTGYGVACEEFTGLGRLASSDDRYAWSVE